MRSQTTTASKGERLTENGISTTRGRGQFAYEEYRSAMHEGEARIQWDYRDDSGVLHSGISRSVEDAQRCASKYGYKREEATQ